MMFEGMAEESSSSCGATAGSSERSDFGASSSGQEPDSAFGSGHRRSRSEEEEDVCRICRTDGDEESPLYHPCACSGSIKYVHQECLLQWLSHSNTRQCEVCKHPFSFSPVYADDTPACLPVKELILGMAVKGAQGCKFLARLLLVLSVWIVCIPYVTCWVFRLGFIETFSEMQTVFLTRCNVPFFVFDCLFGSFLSAGIVFVFLGATSLREYIRHLQEHGPEGNVGNDDFLDRLPGARVGHHGVNEGGDIGRAAGDPLGAQAEPRRPPPPLPEGPPAQGRGPVVVPVAGVGGGDVPVLVLEPPNPANAAMARGGVPAAGVANDLAQRQARGAGLMVDNGDDLEPVDDLPFEELIGMQGPIMHLVENALTILASNIIFLLVVIFAPLIIGRLTLYAMTQIFKAFGPMAVTSFLTTMPPFVTAAALNGIPPSALVNLTAPDGLRLFPPYAQAPITNGSSTPSPDASINNGTSPLEGPLFNSTVGANGTYGPALVDNIGLPVTAVGGFLGAAVATGMSMGNASAQRVVEVLTTPGNTTAASLSGEELLKILSVEQAAGVLVDVVVGSFKLSYGLTVLVGYVAVLALVFCYIAGLACYRLLLCSDRFGGLDTAGRGIVNLGVVGTNLLQQVGVLSRNAAMVVKVGFLLTVELGMFPMACGWWLDICTFAITGTSIQDRTNLAVSVPLTSCIAHWGVGIMYMLQISLFVALLREILRPGVLSFLRDPTDPNYNPFRDLIDDPLQKHARRVLLSVFVYGFLIVMLIFLPAQAAVSLFPTMFPLSVWFSSPLIEIPTDMLLFHVCMPFAVEHFRPRAAMKAGLTVCVTALAKILGLSEFLLPGPEDVARADGGRRPHGAPGGGPAEGAAVLAPPPPPPAQPPAPPPAPLDDDERQWNGYGLRHRGVRPGIPIEEELRVENALPHLRAERVAVGEIVEEDSSSEGDVDEEGLEMEDGYDTDAEIDDGFATRIVLLLLAGWLILAGFNCLAIVVPLSIGRSILSLISRIPLGKPARINDLFAFGFGWYFLSAMAVAAKYTADYLQRHNLRIFFQQAFRWIGIMAKSSVLTFLWFGVVPLLIGLLLDLLILIPLRVPISETPTFLLHQDWALGLLFLKIWTRVALGQPGALGGDVWRARFERVQANGLGNIEALWVLREVIAPVLLHLLSWLLVPWALARGLVPLALPYLLPIIQPIFFPPIQLAPFPPSATTFPLLNTSDSFLHQCPSGVLHFPPALIPPPISSALYDPGPICLPPSVDRDSASLLITSAAFRYAWICCVVAFVSWKALSRARVWILRLHDSIRDDRYLVGRQLHNFKV